MLRIGICDNEILILNQISEIITIELKKMRLKNEIKTFDSGEQLLDISNIKHFDVIFLGIKLKTTNGIKIAREMRKKGYENLIVFITSYVDYATKGYQVNAFRFILKSNMQRELSECLNAIKIMFDKNNTKIKATQLDVDDIVYVLSNNHRIIIHLKNQTQISEYMTLNAFEEKINSKYFCRIHQSYLANIKYVECIERYFASLLGGEKIPISKSRYKEAYQKIVLRKKLWI